MSYRSDHDAALARVDALELEKKRLEAENAQLRAPSEPTSDREHPTRKVGLTIAGFSALFLTVTIAGLLKNRDEQPDPTERFEARLTQLSREHLAKCTLAISSNPHLNATLTDPRGEAPTSVDAIKATAAPCRNDLQVYRDSGVIAPRERHALDRWLAAEDELAGSISRIVVYYGNEPYLLDGYSSAPQLWTEYDRAVAQRDVAIADWRQTH